MLIKIALNGARPKEQNKFIPQSISEIEKEVKLLYENGNKVFHIHCYDENGNESLKPNDVNKLVSTVKNVSEEIQIGISSGDWIEPDVAFFSETTNNAEPSFSPDGRQLYFTSNRSPNSGWNYDIWMIEKSDTGWSDPVRLSSAINTSSGEWHPCVAANGNLYFARDPDADIFVSKFINGQYQPAIGISEINTKSQEWDPYVSPDESYIIFKSDRPGGFGNMDLYISYKEQNGAWGTPINLGSNINTIYHDDSGDITFDGKYLFFARRINSEMDIYWVDASAIFDSTSTGIKKNNKFLKGYNLQQNFPNPFNPKTVIQFSIPHEGQVTIKLYDSLGNELKTLINEWKAEGNYSVELDGKGLSSGIYFYRFMSGNFIDTKKLILIK